MELRDPNVRRIQLGWEVSATPSDEGVRVFGGIWFNSEALQVIRDEQFFEGKVQVFVDPDNLNAATVLMPGYTDPIEVHLQMTVFADMTIGEVLQLMAEYRREDPETVDIYHDRLMEAKIRRFADISSIGVEHNLPRSYTTIEECKEMAPAVFAGTRIIRTETLPGTTAPDAVTKLAPGAAVFQIGGASSVIDGEVFDDPEETAEEVTDPTADQAVSAGPLPSAPPAKTARPQARTEKAPSQSEKLTRPTDLKELK